MDECARMLYYLKENSISADSYSAGLTKFALSLCTKLKRMWQNVRQVCTAKAFAKAIAAGDMRPVVVLTYMLPA